MGEVEDKIWNLTPVLWFIKDQKGFRHDKKYLPMTLAQCFGLFTKRRCLYLRIVSAKFGVWKMDNEGFGLGQINFRFLSRVEVIPH